MHIDGVAQIKCASLEQKNVRLGVRFSISTDTTTSMAAPAAADPVFLGMCPLTCAQLVITEAYTLGPVERMRQRFRDHRCALCAIFRW